MFATKLETGGLFFIPCGTLQAKATLSCPASGVKSAAQPPLLHHSIVSILGTRIRRHPYRTDFWIELLNLNQSQTEPRNEVMKPRSGKPSLAACTLSAICITPHMLSTDFETFATFRSVKTIPVLSLCRLSTINLLLFIPLSLSSWCWITWSPYFYSFESPLRAIFSTCFVSHVHSLHSWTVCKHHPSCRLFCLVRMNYGQIQSACYLLSSELCNSSKLEWESPA